jgi:hypothetical protein
MHIVSRGCYIEVLSSQTPFMCCTSAITPYCVNPDHLFLGTHQDNMADMARKGRRKGRFLGSDNPNAKLSEKDVAQIRALRSSGTSVRSLMKQFGMSDRNIYDIINGKLWK